MMFASFCAWASWHAADRAETLYVTLQRRRILRERQADVWRLWSMVESAAGTTDVHAFHVSQPYA